MNNNEQINKLAKEIKQKIVILSLNKKTLTETEFEKGMDYLEKQIIEILDLTK